MGMQGYKISFKQLENNWKIITQASRRKMETSFVNYLIPEIILTILSIFTNNI